MDRERGGQRQNIRNTKRIGDDSSTASRKKRQPRKAKQQGNSGNHHRHDNTKKKHMNMMKMDDDHHHHHQTEDSKRKKLPSTTSTTTTEEVGGAAWTKEKHANRSKRRPETRTRTTSTKPPTKQHSYHTKKSSNNNNSNIRNNRNRNRNVIRKNRNDIHSLPITQARPEIYSYTAAYNEKYYNNVNYDKNNNNNNDDDDKIVVAADVETVIAKNFTPSKRQAQPSPQQQERQDPNNDVINQRRDEEGFENRRGGWIDEEAGFGYEYDYYDDNSDNQTIVATFCDDYNASLLAARTKARGQQRQRQHVTRTQGRRQQHQQQDQNHRMQHDEVRRERRLIVPSLISVKVHKKYASTSLGITFEWARDDSDETIEVNARSYVLRIKSIQRNNYRKNNANNQETDSENENESPPYLFANTPLREGYHILSINNKSCRHWNEEYARSFLRAATGDIVVVARNPRGKSQYVEAVVTLSTKLIQSSMSTRRSDGVDISQNTSLVPLQQQLLLSGLTLAPCPGSGLEISRLGSTSETFGLFSDASVLNPSDKILSINNVWCDRCNLDPDDASRLIMERISITQRNSTDATETNDDERVTVATSILARVGYATTSIVMGLENTPNENNIPVQAPSPSDPPRGIKLCSSEYICIGVVAITLTVIMLKMLQR